MPPRLDVEINPSKARAGARGVNQSLDSMISKARQTGRTFDKTGTDVDTQFNKIAMGAKRLVGGFIAFQTVRSVVTDAIQTISGFSGAISAVQAVSGSTRQEMSALTDQARFLGATTKFSATEAAQGMEFLARAGFDANEVFKGIGPSLNLAAAGALDLGTSADIVSNIMSGFQLSADQTERAVDVLAQTTRSSNTNVQQLGEAMKFAAPIAFTLGRSVEEAAAAVGVLSNAGIQGSLAGTGLARVLSVLGDQSEKNAKKFAKFGIDLKALNPATTDLATVFKRLEAVQLDVTAATELFDSRGAKAALTISQNADELGKLIQKNKDATGTAQEMARIMSENLQGSFKTLRSAVEELFLQMGASGLEGGMKSLIDTLTDLVRNSQHTAQVLGHVLGGTAQIIIPVFRVLATVIEGVSTTALVAGKGIAALFAIIADPGNAVQTFKIAIADIDKTLEEASTRITNLIGLTETKIKLPEFPKAPPTPGSPGGNEKATKDTKDRTAVIDKLNDSKKLTIQTVLDEERVNLANAKSIREVIAAHNGDTDATRSLIDIQKIRQRLAEDDVILDKENEKGILKILDARYAEIDATDKLVEARRKLQEQQETVKQNLADLRLERDELQEIVKVQGLSQKERDIEIAKIQALNEYKRQGIILNAEERQEVISLVTEIETLGQSLEETADGPLAEFAKAGEDTFGQLEQAATNALGTMEDELVNFVTKGEFSFKRMVDGMLADLARLAVRQSITGPLAGGLSGLFGGGGGGFGSFLGGIFGGGNAGPTAVAGAGLEMQHGGIVKHYQHGGVGMGTDTVPALLTPGEGVFTPEQMRALSPAGSGGNMTVEVHMTVVTPDADSFRKSRGQIEQELALSSQRALQRNAGRKIRGKGI